MAGAPHFPPFSTHFPGPRPSVSERVGRHIKASAQIKLNKTKQRTQTHPHAGPGRGGAERGAPQTVCYERLRN